MLFLLLKYLHLIGAAVLLGTGAGIAFCCAHLATLAAAQGKQLPTRYYVLFRIWFAFVFRHWRGDDHFMADDFSPFDRIIAG